MMLGERGCGKVRALAVLSTQRAAALPDVPTVKDAGIKPE